MKVLTKVEVQERCVCVCVEGEVLICAGYFTLDFI